jgi:hypothetical protein
VNNSSSRFSLYNQATVIYRSFFLVALILTGNFSYSQDSRIIHYQRNCSINTLVLPTDAYNSNLFTIDYPDSIYNSGVLSIKKLRIRNIKALAEFNFTNNIYTHVSYTLNKKNKDKLMKLIAYNSNVYSLDINRRGLKYTISLKVKD